MKKDNIKNEPANAGIGEKINIKTNGSNDIPITEDTIVTNANMRIFCLLNIISKKIYGL